MAWLGVRKMQIVFLHTSGYKTRMIKKELETTKALDSYKIIEVVERDKVNTSFVAAIEQCFGIS